MEPSAAKVIGRFDYIWRAPPKALAWLSEVPLPPLLRDPLTPLTFGDPVHRVLLLSLAALVGCSSSAGVPSGRRDVTTITVGGPEGGTLRLRNEDAPASFIIGVPLAKVWTSLPAVFDSLGVPVTLIDPKQNLIGAQETKVRVRIGGVALSRYFDCGTTQIGANADSYEILLTLLARLKPTSANTTTIEVTVRAVARPVAFRQGYSDCQQKPTGAIDERLVDILRRQATR